MIKRAFTAAFFAIACLCGFADIIVGGDGYIGIKSIPAVGQIAAVTQDGINVYVNGQYLGHDLVKISTDKDGFQGGIVFTVGSVDLSVGFEDFIGNDGLSFCCDSGAGRLLVTFGSSVTINCQKDVLAPLAEKGGVGIVLKNGGRYGFDPSRYLADNQFARHIPATVSNPDIWEVCDSCRSYSRPVVDGELPTEGSANIEVKVNDWVSYNASIEKSTMDDDSLCAAGNSFYRGAMAGYETSGMQNVLVIKTADGSIITQANDFNNNFVYTTITGADGSSRTTCMAIQEQKHEEKAAHPDHLEKLPETASYGMSAAYSMAPAESGVAYVDVMIAYDKTAEAFAESDCGGITNLAMLAIARMNTVLDNSGLADKFLFRLIGITVVEADGQGDIEQVLYNIDGSVGPWAIVKERRNELGADLVSVLVDTGSAYGWVGIGWSLSDEWSSNLAAFKEYSYNVCSVRGVAVADTMTHEIGHNMGAGHADGSHMDSENAGPQFGSGSSGYYFEVGGRRYHTIMGYDVDASGEYYNAAPFFSTPTKTFNGAPVGDAAHDNVSTISRTYLAVANFRTPKAQSVEAARDPRLDDPQAIQAVKLSEIVSGAEIGKAAVLSGALLDAETYYPLGTFEFKLGKANVKTGLSKVTGSYTPIGGKKVTLKIGEKAGINLRDGVAELTCSGNGIGEMTIRIGAGANGKLVFASEDGRATSVDAANPEGTRMFSVMDVSDVIDGVEINRDYLPTDVNPEPVEMGAKWTCAKAMVIAYKKGEWIENNGKAANGKTNCSGLKLTYTAKKGTVKGAFTAYGLQNGKLKKLKFTVSGAVVGGNVYLTAVYKKLIFNCSVK